MFDILNFYPNIVEKTIPLNLLDISSRNYMNWKNEQLLYTTSKDKSESDVKRKWVQLNLFDALWLLIVKELRSLNIDFETIKTVKKIMYSNISFNEEKLNETSNDEFLNSFLKNIPEEHHEGITPLLKDGSLWSLVDQLIDEENVILFKNIGIIFIDVLIRRVFVSLLITKDNGFVNVVIIKNEKNLFHSNNTENNQKIFDSILNDTFINIPITPLILKLFEESAFDKYNLHYQIFNHNEKKIIEALNDDLCKEIKITKHQSGDMTLNLTFEANVKNENAKQIRKILGLKEYERIELIYRNASHLIINNTRKEILKKE